MTQLLTGNEAVARGFYEAGGVVASAYPGTPSTEILENISKYKDELYCEWAPNEKVAMETAIGASIAGARSLAAMKHVGLNVAADPIFTFSYTGVSGGFVFISADDPELHSSQNEQDNRHYAKAAKLLMLEPSNSQEAKDFVRLGFELSEEYDVPVMLRIITRICHSKSLVEIGQREEVPIRPYVKNRPKYDCIPAFARKMHTRVEARQKALVELSNKSPLNYEIDNGQKIGVVSAGVAFQYARDVFGDSANYFKVGMSYPMPLEAIRAFAAKVDKVYVVEELDPFMEDHLKAAGIDCVGKDLIPIEGELNPSIVRQALLGQAPETPDVQADVISRAPAFCAGCPHRGFFIEAGKYSDAIVVGDIGCYALSGAAPYNAKDCSVCMGASISVSHGMKKAFEHYGVEKKVVSIMGDSTFFHTGINGLTGLSYNKGSALTVILDNRTTGMTGHQENPGTGYTLSGEKTVAISIEDTCRALGIKNIRVVDPLDLKAVRESLEWGFAQTEPAVIITRYPCALKKYSEEDIEEFGPINSKCTIDPDKCIGCRMCIRTSCPCLEYVKETKKVKINSGSCTGCTICMQVCPKNAISKVAVAK